MKDTDDVSKLIRLKRYETPGEDYYSRFAAEFKDRQRAELLHKSSFSIFKERALMWWEQAGSERWLVPTGAAAAAVMTIGLVVASSENEPADLPVRGIAELSGDADVSLPPFPDSPNEVIELKLPSSELSPPPSLPPSGSGVLTAGSSGPLIEL